MNTAHLSKAPGLRQREVQSQKGPLAGVRVITVDNYFAGNYGPLLLALHGADVIKIEAPTGGDALRNDAPFIHVDGRSISHGELRLMREKSSVGLDLRSEAGRAVLARLVATADVFWTNIRPRSAARLGIDYGGIRALRPDIVYASLTGFGLPGRSIPAFEDAPAFDIIIQALTGLMARNEDSDGTPQYNGVAIGDQVTSIFTTLGVVMALLDRARTGEGACVDVSMFDSMLAINEKTLSLFSMDGIVRPPRLSATNSPFGAYRAADGYVAVGVGGNAVWARLCGVIGREDLLDDPDLDTGVKRVAAESTRIRPLMQGWLQSKTVSEASALLLAGDVPASPVYDVDDPQLLEQGRRSGVIADIELGDTSKFVVQSPIQFATGAPQPVGAPSVLGAETSAVLKRWLGLSDRDLEGLRADGAIA
jgi:crotonobetainyl-CoA:carnitine CoA-transferase CaiB-like acyl-CoA transferase